MSGHSKWHTIRHKKALTDLKKGKIFTKLGRELVIASKLGGDDLQHNYRLRLAVDKAKAANMPSSKIQRAIEKGAGKIKGEDIHYEDIIYEAYGPEGVAFIIIALTDNRNRTVAEIRRILTKKKGTLAESGSVLWMFKRLSYLFISFEDDWSQEENFLTEIFNFNLFDFEKEDNGYSLYAEIEDFENIRKTLLEKEFTLQESSLIYLSKNFIEVPEDKLPTVEDLYETLDSHDDVQEVYWNLKKI